MNYEQWLTKEEHLEFNDVWFIAKHLTNSPGGISPTSLDIMQSDKWISGRIQHFFNLANKRQCDSEEVSLQLGETFDEFQTRMKAELKLG